VAGSRSEYNHFQIIRICSVFASLVLASALMLTNSITIRLATSSTDGFNYIWINWVLFGVPLAFKISSIVRTINLYIGQLRAYKHFKVINKRACLLFDV